MKSSLNQATFVLLALNISHELGSSNKYVTALQCQFTTRLRPSMQGEMTHFSRRMESSKLFLSKEVNNDPNKDDFSDLDISRTQNRSLITSINGAKEFESYIDTKTDSRLTIIKFYASWCKSCAKFGLRYKKLAHERGDCIDSKGVITNEGNVRFAEVEFGQNLKLCRSLGIKRLPYIYIYRGDEGHLCDFSCGPKKFPVLVDKVNEYLGMSQEEIDFFRVFNEGTNLANEIAPILQKEHLDMKVNNLIAAGEKLKKDKTAHGP